MSDLSEFLLARIAEDEAAIKSRDMSRPIHFVGCYYYENSFDANRYCDCDEDGSASRRYLAECAAKRRIVEADARLWTHTDEAANQRLRFAPDGVQVGDEWMSGAEFERRFTVPAQPSDHVRLLALPYADHEDYREEWRL